MDIAPRRFAEVTLVSPSGRIDHSNVQAFDAALRPALDEVGAGGALVLDLSALEYVSSVGLRAFLVAERQLRDRKAQFIVAGLQSVVREIFAISRFDRILTVAASLDEALALCSIEARAAYRAHAGGGA
jgi:anti-sigma B factor antagonist/stage II sporulation protein AA (anti-sigma F factor antagonist)